MTRARVAVYGGDERVARLEWPRHLDVKHYAYKSPREKDRLSASLASGSVDHLVLLTSYMGHAPWDELSKARDVNVIKWSRSPMQLMREIGSLIPPAARAPDPLTTPGIARGEPGRGPLTVHGNKDNRDFGYVLAPDVARPLHKALQEANERASDIVAAAAAELPKLNPLGDAIAAYIKRKGLLQREFAAKIGTTQPTVSQWIAGRVMPTGDRLKKIRELLDAPEPKRNVALDDAHAEWLAARNALRAAQERLALAEERLSNAIESSRDAL